MSVSAPSGGGYTPSAPSAPISGGVATFSGLSLSGSAGTTALVFSDGTRSVTSNPVTVNAPAASTIIKDTLTIADNQSVLPSSSFPTMPRVRVLDGSSNPVSGVTVNFSAAGGSVGSIATSDGSGYASPTYWTAPASVGSSVVTASLSGGASQMFTSYAGTPTSLTVATQSTNTVLAGANGTPLNFGVKVLDAGGRTMQTAGIAVVPGNGGESYDLLNGTTQTTSAAGVASFTSLRIGSTSGFQRKVYFNATYATNPLTVAQSVPIIVNAGPAAALAVDATTKIGVAQAGAAVFTKPIFKVTDGYNAPSDFSTASVTFSSLTGGCSFAPSSATPDNTGSVTAPLVLPGSSAKGCTILATGTGSFSTKNDTAYFATYPAGTTNVWFGQCCTSWSNPLNWYSVSNKSNAVPTSVDTTKVFIPNWGTLANAPTVDVFPQINRLSVDTGVVVNLNGGGAIVGSGGVTGYATFTGGYVKMYATAPATGSFDALWVGDFGSPGNYCPAASGLLTATLTSISAKTIRAYCPTVVNASVSTTGAFTTFANGGALIKSAGANLSVGGVGTFSGDSLITGLGTLNVSGAATLGGKKINIVGGTVTLSSTASFAASNATYSGTSMTVTGDATFGGTGAGIQNLTGGTLTLLGNLTQLTGDTTGKTFFTDNTHLTSFSGTALQTISFGAPTSAGFGRVSFNNTVGGARLVTSVSVSAGTASPRAQLSTNAKLTMDSPSTANFTVNGNLQLFSGALLTVNSLNNVQVSGGTCSGVSSGATVTGAGTVNGSSITASTCSP